MNYGEFAGDFQKSPGGWFPYLHSDRNSLENIFYNVLGTTGESSWMIYTWNYSESN